MIKSTLRLFHTLRYYKLSQLSWYSYYFIRRKIPARWWFNHVTKLPLKINNNAVQALIRFCQNWAQQTSENSTEVQQILQGEIYYAGEVIPIRNLLNHSDTTISPLALYGLHSFDFLWSLCLQQIRNHNKQYGDFAKHWIIEWIKHNPIGKSIAWDPYPTSYRLRYWLIAYYLWNWNEPEIIDSLQDQNLWLSKSIESHLKGNHIIQNLTGLIVTSEILYSSSTRFLSLLETELSEQILEDGGHYERTPMYHIHVLIDLLWIFAILPAPPTFLKETIQKMLNFLSNIVFPNGEIPLFGDSVSSHLPKSNTVFQVAQQYGFEIDKIADKHHFVVLPSSGYYKNHQINPCYTIICKLGLHGPDYQLAHAHSDVFSYELMLKDSKIVVDSGMNGYAGNPYRHFQRSTSAHNTVYIEGEEQLECWGTFRVARRGRLILVQYDQDQEDIILYGTYRYFTGTYHTRFFYFTSRNGIIIYDILKLKRQKSVFNLIHLHPSVQPVINKQCVILTLNKDQLFVNPLFGEDISIEQGKTNPYQGWYSEEFGSAVPNPVIILQRSSTTHYVKTGYWISFEEIDMQNQQGEINRCLGKIEQIIKQKNLRMN